MKKHLQKAKQKPSKSVFGRTKRTLSKKELFLSAYENNALNVSAACKLANINRRQTVYEWRENDEAFRQSWDSIESSVVESAEQELYRRAVVGVNEPVYQGKELVGHVRRYSDTCLIFMLKAHKPQKYTQVQKIAPTDPTGEHAYGLREISTDELLSLAREQGIPLDTQP